MSSAPSKPRPQDTRPIAGTSAWRSLGARLAIWYLVVTLASFIAIATLFALRTRAFIEREGQRSAEGVLDRYRTALESGGPTAVRALFASSDAEKRALSVRVTDERDIEIFTISSDDDSSRVAEVVRKGERTAPLESHEMPKNWHVAVAHVAHGENVDIVTRDDVAPRVWENAREIMWLILAGGLSSAILGAFVISRRALRPVGDLARATQNILDSGDLGLRVPERGSKDDLDELGVLFNRMLARNEHLVIAMKESLDNVAHDLRTPLARLRTGAELALRDAENPGKQGEALADVIEEADRVLGMLKTVMDISEAEAGAMRLEKQREDLAEIAREAVELYEHVASDRGVHVTTKLAPAVFVMIDKRRILQACANLIDNAIKYTPSGGHVEVAVTSDDEWGILSIADNGVGIAEGDRKRIWERLFRGDRSRAERGLGLGLSLVKAIVEAHGGEVRLREDVDTGATFEVRLRSSGARGSKRNIEI